MFDRIIAWENLLLAYKKAAKGKRGRDGAARFEYRLEDNLLALQEELQSGAYQPGAYTHFYIHEPKRRRISAAPFRDRVVHHALCNIIEPVFERSFIHHSYANRVGRGTHRALDACQKFARQCPYVLHLDVEQFFPSIDHQILIKFLSRRIEDLQVMDLITRIVAGGDQDGTGRGLPIGNLTSQFWANCYLSPLDHFITRQLGAGRYVRYVDDLVLFAQTPRVLIGWQGAIATQAQTLGLRLHPGAQPRPVEEGVSFLGFRVFPNRRRLKRRKAVRFARTLRSMLQRYGNGDIELDRVSVRVQSWVNHVCYANTFGLRAAIFGLNAIHGGRNGI
jgi:retron-type reverse transcriptase